LAAEAIERRARRRPERHAPLLALHHQEAANWEQAWRFGVIAAEQAASRWAPSEAADLYLRALRIDPAEVADDERQRAAEALGEAALLAGRYEDSDFGYGLALDPAEPGSLDAIRINRKRAALIRTRGDLAEAVELLTGLEAGLTDVEAAAARQERVAVRISLAGALQRQGEYARCADLCLAAVEEAEKIGDEKALAHGCFLMITTNLALGRDDERDYAAVALDIYERLGDLVGQGDVLNNSGMRSYYRGDWDTTVREWELSRDAYRRAGYATGAATADNNLAEVLSDQGHLDRAEERFRDALRAYEAAGFSIGIALARSNLGRLAGRRGRLDEALEWLRSGRASFDELGAQSYATEADVRIAEAFAFAGRCSDAEAALAEIPKADVPGLEALIDRIRACTAARSGDLETAAGLLRDSAEAARTADVPFELGLTLDALARFDADPAVSAEAGEILGRLGAEDAIRLPWPQGMPATPE
jgi:tetratricopeptide (TPR) repeat protein